MTEYTEDTFDPEDEFVDAELPNFRNQSTKFDEDDDDDRQVAHHSTLPDVVRNFVTYFWQQIVDQNVHEIHNLYENSLNKLTERFFKQSPWPHVESIRPLVSDKEPVFFILYKELYYRHIYAKLQPTLEQRFESWQNYRDLFDYLLRAGSPAEAGLQLPTHWLWDIVDEFIYQFQSFYQYRSKLKNKTPEEVALLKSEKGLQVWNVNDVIATLHALIDKSKIVNTLENERKADPKTKGSREEDATGLEFDTHPLYKMLGYFCLISLCRIHCLLGDYYLALKTLDPVDPTKKGPHSRVTACHITLYYYMGFAYLMMRRYADAIKAFATILLYINRTKQFHTRSYQYDEIVKKNEQMYALLAIAVSLCPTRIDENVHAVLRDKYSEKMQKMQRGDAPTFEELFAYACPKFISPSLPDYEEDPPSNFNQEALRLQSKLFLNEVSQQQPAIRSFLKLYSTITTTKLAKFLETEEPTCHQQLLGYKHKTRNLVWNGGNVLNGKWTSSSDVDFYIEKDMVHIIDAKVTRRYGEFFIRHINKFEDAVKDLSGR